MPRKSPTARRVAPVFKRALACFDSYSEFARQVGVDRQVVNYWLRIGYVPTDHALPVAHATDNEVTAKELLVESMREKERARIEREVRREHQAPVVAEGSSDAL